MPSQIALFWAKILAFVPSMSQLSANGRHPAPRLRFIHPDVCRRCVLFFGVATLNSRPPPRRKSGLIAVAASNPEQVPKRLLRPRATVSPTALRRASLSNSLPQQGSVQATMLSAVLQRAVRPAAQRASPHRIGAMAALAGGAVVLLATNIYFALAIAVILFGCAYKISDIWQKRALSQQVAEELALAKQFDQHMQTSAPRLPSEAQQTLMAMKTGLLTCLVSRAQIRLEGGLFQDEHLFVEQLVLHYLPDCMTPFLNIPADKQETLLLEHGKSPKQLLLDQLVLLGNRLQALEDNQTQQHGDKLALHERFLAEKSSGREI